MRLDLSLSLSRMTTVGGGEAEPVLTMVNQANTTVTDLGGGEWRVEKTSGVEDWNASATGTEPLAGDFILRFTPEVAGLNYMVGVDADPTGTVSYDSLDIDLYMAGGTGVVKPFNNGAGTGEFEVPLVVNDTWFVKRAGDAISVGNGGEDGVTGYVERATFTKAGTLYVDSSLYHIGAKFKVKLIAASVAIGLFAGASGGEPVTWGGEPVTWGGEPTEWSA